MRRSVTCVIGGQWGSEGKGAVVAKMARDFDCHVRTGGPNAGHSHSFKGTILEHQQLPIGIINQRAEIYLGAGAVVSPRILLQEIVMVATALGDTPSFIAQRVHVDPQAVVVTDWVHSQEGGTEGLLQKQIGSTGEGVGLARKLKMDRGVGQTGLCVLARDVAPNTYSLGVGTSVVDFASLVRPTPVRSEIQRIARVGRVLLEGTQGWGLSLHHGTWPYVTSSDTGAAQLLADTGLGPRAVEDVVVVFRSYPIRVAGNSGPMGTELTWKEVSDAVGRPLEERTTVTQKIRRVAMFNPEMVRDACASNGASCAAAMFADYVDTNCAGATHYQHLSQKVESWIANVEKRIECRIRFIGTGGAAFSVIDLDEMGV